MLTQPIPADLAPVTNWPFEHTRQDDKRLDAAASHAATAAYHRIVSCFHLVHPNLTDTEIRDAVESIIAAECRKRMVTNG